LLACLRLSSKGMSFKEKSSKEASTFSSFDPRFLAEERILAGKDFFCFLISEVVMLHPL
jgi:hypothetical protein